MTAELSVFEHEEQADICPPPISYPVQELPYITGISRSAIYKEMRMGNLVSFKVGRGRFVRHSSLLDWMAQLELETTMGD